MDSTNLKKYLFRFGSKTIDYILGYKPVIIMITQMPGRLSNSKLKHDCRFIIRILSIVFPLSILISNLLYAQDIDIKASEEKNLRKNSIYFEILGNAAVWSVNYDRIIPLNNEIAFFLRVGGNEYHGRDTTGLSFNFLGTAGILYGGPIHFLESSLGYTHFLNFPDRLIILTAGYRLQGRKGLVIRATPMYIYNTEKGDTFGNSLWFGLSFGYSF